jgi:hypothetical protein
MFVTFPDVQIVMDQGRLEHWEKRMRTNILKAGATALFLALTSSYEAVANGQTPTPTPEFDGPAGITAIALLAGIVALVYHKVRR